VWSPASTIDLTAPLDQLAMVMHQAGIVNGNGGNGHGNGKGGNGHRRAGSPAGRQGAGSTSGGGDPAVVALARLQETMERAGIWRR
jgi:hypothetical protein